MKTMLNRMSWLVVLGTALNLMCIGLVRGDEPAAAQKEIEKEKTLKGLVTFVDQTEKTAAVKGFWGARTFNVATDCKVSLEDQPAAALADLHPGQMVEVRYQNAHGVLIARQIAQHDVRFTGYINALDATKRTLVVKHGVFSRNFALGENCNVVLRNDKAGSLNELKVGHTVTVVYEPVNDRLMARKIEQTSSTFTGNIEAIDATTRTVKAKSLMTERKFNLADGCKIVIAGKPTGELSALRIGDRATFSYEDANGVLVASRIGRDEPGLNNPNGQGMANNESPYRYGQ